ncbi:DnaJ domain-containing protein [Phenylobacterium zucineum]|nr:DnaJ domain-containing protein [Phenylobacterium zucineum]
MRDHYEVLGVSPEAEDVVIDAAYRALMKRHHPDVRGGAGEARAKEINEAYRVLRDPDERARYDRTNGSGRSSAASGRARPSSPEPPARPARAARPPVPTPAPAPPLPLKGKLSLAGWASIGLASVILVGAMGSLLGAAETTAPGPAADVAPADAAAEEDVSTSGPAAAPASQMPEDEASSEVADAPGAQPSFDCGRADTDVLRMICMIPDLANADVRLASAYQTALSTADDPSRLRDEQRAWLERRDAAPADPRVLLSLYQARMAELTGPSSDEPIF